MHGLHAKMAKSGKKAEAEAKAADAEAPLVDVKLWFLVVGTWAAFVVFGMAQEGLTRTKFGAGPNEPGEQFKFTTFLVLLQSVGNSLVAAALLILSYGTKTSFGGGVALKEWMIVALAYLGAHKFGLWSLLYIPFPLQVLVKSCKTIPVMIGEIVLAGAKPGAAKIMSVLVLTAGIGLFMLFKPSKSAGSGDTFEYNADLALGVGLIVAALFMDGVYGPYQNKICDDVKKATGEELSPYHLMFNMNFYQGVCSLLLLGAQAATDTSGEPHELLKVQAFVERHPSIISMMISFSLAMAVGNIFIYQLQRDYGALVVTTTTTVRKFLSVLASSLPKEGVCQFLPVLPEGACGLAAFPGCALVSCASISGFGNKVEPLQWLGVALVIMSKPLSGRIVSVLGLEEKKAKKE